MSDSVVVIRESCELPLTNGKIEVDSSMGPVTIFMKQGKTNQSITITKITNDNNMISLYSENTLINGAEITIFGLPSTSEFKKGKIRTITLFSDGPNWKIIHEH